MQTRRSFLRSVAFATAAPGLVGVLPTPAASVGSPAGLRTITYNILKCHGFTEDPKGTAALKGSIAPSQIPRRIALELALYKPDIVSFQEAPAEAIVASIAADLGMKHVLFPGGWNGALLTRFEILEAQNCPLQSWRKRPKDLFTRHWGRAILRTPNGTLHFFSAHLHPSDEAIRSREVSEALLVMGPALKNGESVLFQGDLNHRPTGPEYPRWAAAGLVDTFKHLEPDSVDRSFQSYELEKRIDYVWAAGPLARRARRQRILFERAFRVNRQDPLSFALSDHLPVLAEFS